MQMRIFYAVTGYFLVRNVGEDHRRKILSPDHHRLRLVYENLLFPKFVACTFCQIRHLLGCLNLDASDYCPDDVVLFQSLKSYTKKPLLRSFSFCSICRAIIPYCSFLFLLCQSTYCVFSCNFSRIF